MEWEPLGRQAVGFCGGFKAHTPSSPPPSPPANPPPPCPGWGGGGEGLEQRVGPGQGLGQRWEGPAGLRTSLRNGGLDGTSEQELPNRASFPGFRFEVPFLVQIQIYGGHKDGVFRQGRVPRPIGPKVSQGLLDPCVSTMVWVLQYQHQLKGFSGTSGSLCFHYVFPLHYGLGSSRLLWFLLHGKLD